MKTQDDFLKMLACRVRAHNTTHIAPDGFVTLVNQMGDDDFICEAARIGRASSNPTESLIRYMLRHHHTSPFEFVVFVFHVRLPIFVARQWMRHRAGTFNEWSARYMELPDKYWLPADGWRGQGKTNRQGSEGTIEYQPRHMVAEGLISEDIAMVEYRSRIEAGVAREQARSCLPVSMYTEFYWKVDLHNLLHFLYLRTDKHAQKEIRDYADAIEDIIAETCPISVRAWREHRKLAVTLSTDEQALLRDGYASFYSEREREEAVAKLHAIGLVTTVQDGNVLRLVKS